MTSIAMPAVMPRLPGSRWSWFRASYASAVTRSALQNAASIAGLLLTTECLITEVPEKEKGPKADPHHGAGGGMEY